MFINETPPSEFYNLPLILAFGVLDEVLGELANQGVFSCRQGALLGEKMTRSQSILPWVDYAAVERAKNLRNAVAHDGALLSKADCLGLIALVETELRAWQVL